MINYIVKGNFSMHIFKMLSISNLQKSYKPKIEIIDDDDEDEPDEFSEETNSSKPLIEEVVKNGGSGVTASANTTSYESTQKMHSEGLIHSLSKMGTIPGAKTPGKIDCKELDDIAKMSTAEKIQDLAANLGSTVNKTDADKHLLWDPSDELD